MIDYLTEVMRLARPRKKKSEAELLADVEDMAKRRQDAEKRLRNARKAESDAQKKLNEMRVAERSRRMALLQTELANLGYAMETDNDIPEIVTALQNVGSNKAELEVLRGIRNLIESAVKKPIRTMDALHQFIRIMELPREIQASKHKITLTSLIALGYTKDSQSVQMSITDKAE